MGNLNRKIDSKADKNQTEALHETTELKIGVLDKNQVLLAQDFETFQKVINKMHKSIIELQEVNKDVLLGKKSVNCLSCAKGNDGYEAL
jgi:hypothetical protein